MMIPICVLTRNRHSLLDITLRSLSATNLPSGQELVILDDGSNNPDTRSYLYSSSAVDLDVKLPAGTYWRKAGLNNIKPNKEDFGIDGKIHVVPLREPGDSVGVVVAGKEALRYMMKRAHRGLCEDGFIMLQDDVVFEENWYYRLVDSAIKQESVGLVAGCCINAANSTSDKLEKVIRYATAQCYYFTPDSYNALDRFVETEHYHNRIGLDVKLCYYVNSDSNAFRLKPAVCQHIGCRSTVRPGRQWKRGKLQGRVDSTFSGPAVLAGHVREFDWNL